MKTTYSFLVLLAASTSLCLAQEAKPKLDAPNLDDPKIRATVEAKALDAHQVESRKEDGQSLLYSLKTQKPYTGWAKAYHGNGVLKFLGSVKNGKPHGLVITFYENQQKKSQYHYRNGMAQGLTRAWYWGGQIQEKAELKDDVVNGLNTTWHENGQKMSEGKYQDGLQQGPHTKWYENGQKAHEFNYKDGMFHGLNTKWDKEGHITSQAKYQIDTKVETIK
jgi:antitoxin component YwqK of YwqJK toxin-antitoxin module